MAYPDYSPTCSCEECKWEGERLARVEGLPPGEIRCPLKGATIGAGRCVEYQATGCTCERAADPWVVRAALRSPAKSDAPAIGRAAERRARRVRARAFRRGVADGVGIDVLADAWGVCERTVQRVVRYVRRRRA